MLSGIFVTTVLATPFASIARDNEVRLELLLAECCRFTLAARDLSGDERPFLAERFVEPEAFEMLSKNDTWLCWRR